MFPYEQTDEPVTAMMRCNGKDGRNGTAWTPSLIAGLRDGNRCPGRVAAEHFGKYFAARKKIQLLLRWGSLSGRGIAAVEFAMTLPILVFFLAGVTDFGIVYYRQSCLSNAVAAGAEYALLKDQQSPPVTAANIQTVMQNAAAQSMPNATVTATATSPTLCYCITGTSPSSTMTATTCGATCASGGTAGKYVQLTLTHNYSAILPTYSMLAGTTTLSQSAWVPLQ
jgi:Flp pilus assembly protein TadG